MFIGLLFYLCNITLQQNKTQTMKTSFFKTALLLTSFEVVVFTSCKKKDDDATANQTATIISTMNNDGYIENTNLFPFTQGTSRVVNTYLVNYGTLDGRDYDGDILADCGVIASTPTSVLTEHPLDVSIPVARYITSNASVPDLQFRLEFTHGDDIATLANLLYNAMWCIYSGENQEALLNAYRPVLVLTYHYDSNKQAL
jgi:hypothetical protein